MLCSHFLVTSDLFLERCLSLIIWSQTMQSLFCQNNVDNWENVVCACRNVNRSLFSVALRLNQLSHVLFGCTGVNFEQCCPCLVLCVLSEEGSCDKVNLLLSDLMPGSHTPCTTDSPVCSLSSPLILVFILTLGLRTEKNQSFIPLNKA